ncbi:MAG: caspase family protein [Deltaproteobacteria bacterium]|nr:caspase family protein [Deltaproteobacteria bacterium]
MNRTLLTAVALAVSTAAAHADPAPATYALVIGSNAGGPGQVTLHYAEDDARRVAGVLTELGGFSAANVDVVVHPTPQLVRDRLTRLAARVQADITAGRQARIFFYYSGHARSNAIDLGNEQLPLTELRQRLFAVPATLNVVVLDACQSGAFSRVKGATPAADFSFSSRQQLAATGVAVLASSSGSELSQESERLRSSYFTHHLLVGLRGAGDTNTDGQVSIDEAYRYAYHQTLLATAETAVGGQHVSLEVELKGHGEVAMSFPRKASAAIELPAALEGKALVEDRRAHVVVAETFKARGAAVRIAVAPGEYTVLVRRGDRLARCEINATGNGTTVVALDRCSNEAVVDATRKGGGFARPTRIEVSLAVGGERGDAYTRTLESFEWNEDSDAPASGFAIAGLRQIHEHLWVGGAVSRAGGPAWTRETDFEPLRFAWNTTTAVGLVRGEYGEGMTAYGQLGVGLGLGTTEFVDAMGVTTRETFVGPAFTLGAGLRYQPGWLGGLGFALGYQLDFAPIVDNLVGDTHASGGHRVVLGASYGF